MATHVDMIELKREVADRARAFDRDVTPDFVHIYEDPDSSEQNTLIVEIAARRDNNRTNWIEQRLRFSQSIRDWLVAHGDERYPLVQIFKPEEWALRNG